MANDCIESSNYLLEEPLFTSFRGKNIPINNNFEITNTPVWMRVKHLSRYAIEENNFVSHKYLIKPQTIQVLRLTAFLAYIKLVIFDRF